ncbi:hypothetical protein VRK_15490 [Vibrio sp. MEBiC08052]|nr:hypothetical protein VRK_15490 [Vibrio sp. MEBiC08052]
MVKTWRRSSMSAVGFSPESFGPYILSQAFYRVIVRQNNNLD